jgi:hypothetical protein
VSLQENVNSGFVFFVKWPPKVVPANAGIQAIGIKNSKIYEEETLLNYWVKH